MPDWTQKEDAKLRRLHADGDTPAEMVANFPGRSRSAIVGRLNRLGLRTREAYYHKQAQKTTETRELIIKLRCQPWNWASASIAQALEVDPQIVHNIINKHTEAL